MLLPGSKSAKYIVGSLLNDTYDLNPSTNNAVNGTNAKDVIHGGLGNDFIFGAQGDDLIDGEKGDDVIDAGKGNNLIVSGEGNDKIILDEGESVILDGTAEDRLFVRASLVGGTKVNGEDRLIPLLGGVISYSQDRDFGGNPINDPAMQEDTDNDGNLEYWFASHLLKVVAEPNGSSVDLDQNLFDQYSLSPFSIIYEMDGADMVIYFYKGFENISALSSNGGDIGGGVNIFDRLEPTIKVILPNYQNGHFGLQFSGPNEVQTVFVDSDTFANAAAVNQHNNTVQYITNDGNLDELLGPLVANNGTLFSDNEIEVSTGEDDDVFTGSEADETIEGEAGDDQLDGAGGDDEIDGGIGDDEISGGSGENELNGGPGDDTFTGGDGVDTIDGGSDFDTIDYSGSLLGIAIDLEANIATGGDATGDQFPASL